MTASLNGSPLPTSTTVTVSRTGGTATSGTDYPPVSAFTVTIQSWADQRDGDAVLRPERGRPGGECDETVILTGSVDGADLWHGDSDDHGRRRGADGGHAVA